MDESNVKSWVSQPDVCRCCLSTSGAWDLTASYITDAGIKEVFSDMLQECYGITLSRLAEWGPSRMVCGSCAGHLRGARIFRTQVLRAEACFTEYCSSSGASVAIKIEEEACEDVYSNDCGDCDDEVNKEAFTVHSNTKTKHTKYEKKQNHRRKKQKMNSEVKRKRAQPEDGDSDTPIAALKETEPSPVEIKVDDELQEDQKKILNRLEVDAVQKMHSGLQHTVRPNVTKQLSERKRVILTCGVVLKDTTACPFRHHKSWFQCFFCAQDFMEISPLRTHTIENHPDIDKELKKMKRFPRSLQIDITNLECRHCRAVLTDVEAMRAHLQAVHSKVIYNECIADYKVDCSPYFCHICNQEFHVFRTLTTHLNEHYANCICDVCGRSFINSKRLKVHKRTHERGDFPCTACGKVLKTRTSKANHMESAHSKRVIKCQICFEPMKHYNDRIKHMSEAHGITHKFKCPICAREYNIKHYLATHMRQTHGSRNKRCATCGMAFVTNHGLKKHMLKHSGAKPFACAVCDKAYARSYTLREHMRAHDSGRPFKL